jgi:Ca-activated chloride channel family protein
MNDSHQNHDPADLHDRLMDQALAEVVGGETPPDLSAKILDQVIAHKSEPATTPRRSLTAVGWTILTLAASISIVATAVYLFSNSSHSTYRTASVGMERAKSKGLRESSVGLQGQINDGNQQTEETGAAHFVPLASTRVAKDASGPSNQSPLKEPFRQNSFSAGYEWTADSPTIRGGRPESDESVDRSGPARPGIVAGKQIVPTSEGREVEFVATGVPWDSDASTPLEADPRRGRARSEVDAHDLLTDLKIGGPLQDRYGTTWGFRAKGQVQLLNRPAKDLRELAERLSDRGTGPSSPGDQYTRIVENPFVKAIGGDALSTFSIDVDTASYANVRQFLMGMRQLPPPDAVRIEELVNYFQYDYQPPQLDTDPSDGLINEPAPFAAHVEVASCPWAPEHRLVRIGIKGREIAREKWPKSSLVFLVDVSGSMDEPNKLPLVISGLRQLTRELGENDRVAIVVYASSEGLALESTRGDQQQTILTALDRLQAGGSTAGGAGIQLAYQIAEDHFIPGGTNRVVLCTDGDFNVGVTSTAELERLVSQKAKDTKVFLSVLGFGRGNLNDAMMQTIADRGNGNHHYVDNLREARKVLVEEMTGTLITIAKDVKIQVEFNPAQVAAYRLIGYENRMLRTEDFNDDRKDAGEIGAGHTVTALYEVVPAGKQVDLPAVDELKYQRTEQSSTKAIDKNPTTNSDANSSLELLTLKMRYKDPEGDVSRKLEWPVTDAGVAFQDASTDFQFASAVASFGLILRGSEHRGNATLDAVAEIAEGAIGKDEHGYRTEFVELVRQAKSLLPADESQQDATHQKE